MSDENPPVDAVAEAAAEVVQAAQAWRFAIKETRITKEEWRLYEACNRYGDKYRGLRAQ